MIETDEVIKPTQCGVTMTQEEVADMQRHYLELGRNIGRHEFNLNSFCLGLWVGVCLLVILTVYFIKH